MKRWQIVTNGCITYPVLATKVIFLRLAETKLQNYLHILKNFIIFACKIGVMCCGMHSSNT